MVQYLDAFNGAVRYEQLTNRRRVLAGTSFAPCIYLKNEIDEFIGTFLTQYILFFHTETLQR